MVLTLVIFFYKQSKYFLNSKGPQPSGTFIFTLDIVGLYINVPTSRGPEVQKKRLLKANMSIPRVEWTTECTVALLKHNTFEYDGKLYTQRDGAGIGQPNAGSYAGIYMAEIEEEGLKKWRRRGLAPRAEEPWIKGINWRKGDRAEVDWWHRFRDDIKGLFRGTLEEFQEFLDNMNSIDPCIKFTSDFDYENNSVNFLDTTIAINAEGYLTTDLYVKPNTLNQLLSPRSAHPPSVTRSSVYSLALRIRRICSSDERFEVRADELKKKLLERKYSETVIDAGIERGRRVQRSEALKKVEKKPEGNEEGRQHRLIVEYDRRTGPALRQTLHNNYEAAANRDIRFKKMFPKTPKPVFTKGKNIKQMLIKAGSQ